MLCLREIKNIWKINWKYFLDSTYIKCILENSTMFLTKSKNEVNLLIKALLFNLPNVSIIIIKSFIVGHNTSFTQWDFGF